MKTPSTALRLAAAFASAAITWSLLSGVYALAQPSAAVQQLAQGMVGGKIVRG